MSGTEAVTLSPQEQAYFSSGGESDLPASSSADGGGQGGGGGGGQGGTDQVASGEPGGGEQGGQGQEGAQQGQQGQQGQGADAANKMVPLAALHQERERVRQMRENQLRMEERFNLLVQAFQSRNPQQQQEQQQQVPDRDKEPVPYFEHKIRELEQMVQPLQQTIAQTQQQRVQEAAMQQLATHVQAQERQFVQQVPDYTEAAQFLRESSFRGLKALGLSDEHATMGMQNGYAQLCARLARNGESIPQYLYEQAKAQGYKPKAQQGQQSLDAVQNGMRQARGMGSGGAATGQKLSLQALAQMDRGDFEKAVGDDAAWRKLIGG